MTKRYYVVDTGYLLELFKVDGHSNDSTHQAIDEKFKQAAHQGFQFYVPVSVLFELANHIAHINNGYRRKQLAERLAKTVESCVKDKMPWIITPCKELAAIEQLAETLLKFSNLYSIQGLGLTDTSVLLEAEKLSKKYRQYGYKVHIWTTDNALKALAPDAEE